MQKKSKICLMSLALALLAQDPLSAACGPWGCGVGGNQPAYPQGGYQQGPVYSSYPQGGPVYTSQPRQSRGRPFNQGLRQQYSRSQRQNQGYYSQPYYDSHPVDQAGWGEQHSYESNQGFEHPAYVDEQHFQGAPHQQGFNQSYYQQDDQGYFQGQDQYSQDQGRFGQSYYQQDQNFNNQQGYTRANAGQRNYGSEAATPQSFPIEDQNFRQNPNQPNRQNPNPNAQAGNWTNNRNQGMSARNQAAGTYQTDNSSSSWWGSGNNNNGNTGTANRGTNTYQSNDNNSSSWWGSDNNDNNTNGTSARGANTNRTDNRSSSWTGRND